MNLATPLLVGDCDGISHSNFTTTARLSPANSPKGYPGFSILGMFEGLVVESKLWDKNYIVRNPATRQILHLPKPPTGYFCQMFFDFDSSQGEAKLLYAYSLFRVMMVTSQNGYEILKIGVNKQLRTLKPPSRDQCLIVSRDRKNMHFISPVWTGLLILVDI